MATEAIEQAPAAEAAAPAKSGGARNLIVLAVAGLIAGSGVGLFGVGPVLAKRKASHPAPVKVEEPRSAVTHSLENLVLNPAGSGGTRFLMVTAAFELKDASVEQLMKDHEAECRDRILALLGKKTVEELTNPADRDAIKQQVLDAIVPMFPKGVVLKVFFPQFVIQ
ncbi:MAG: flagellar basal body-associated FliL family protein [Gemmatimonadaceae bacterium]